MPVDHPVFSVDYTPEEYNLSLSKSGSEGPVQISRMDAVKFKADPVAFVAKLLKLPKETVLAYEVFAESDFRCTGTARSGKPCRQVAEIEVPKRYGKWRAHEFLTLRKFADIWSPGDTDRCRHH